MVKHEAVSSFQFALSVAAACCPKDADDKPAGIARYLKAVLASALQGIGVEVETKPIPYRIGSKVPVMITLSGRDPRLLWYQKGMSAAALSNELFWLLSDHPLLIGRISA